MQNNFWKNKKVLITGHTGFKGCWLTLMMHNLGAKIYGYAIDPISKPDFFDEMKLSRFLEKDYRKDISDINTLKKIIRKHKPQIIFHLAAQSSVLVSYKNPIDTIMTNVIGTTNILEAIKSSKSVKAGIIVTTDKVYLNLEKQKKFNENDPLGGHDIYSGSKAASEIIFQSFLKSFFQDNRLNLATVRSGNCIGGGDWTKDRIMKDCAEKLIFNKKIVIRSPNASRPWQHVIEPLHGYIKLAEKMYSNKKDYNGAWNFGPNLKDNMKVWKLVNFSKKILASKSKILREKPKFYESSHLSLNSSKTLKKLKWKTLLKAKEAIEMTLDWYSFYYKNRKYNKDKIVEFSINQIKNYYKIILNR